MLKHGVQHISAAHYFLNINVGVVKRFGRPRISGSLPIRAKSLKNGGNVPK